MQIDMSSVPPPPLPMLYPVLSCFVQVPQFILDDFLETGRGTECTIFCTQPRRISAVSVAERVAAERAEKLGESTGYMIRLEQ